MKKVIYRFYWIYWKLTGYRELTALCTLLGRPDNPLTPKLACEKHFRVLIGKDKCVDCTTPKVADSRPLKNWEEEFSKMWTKWSNPNKYLSHNDLKKASKDFISQLLKQQKEEILSKAIKIFEPYKTEPMTGNVVILELRVLKDSLGDKE